MNIKTNSLKINKGDIFVAVKTALNDGHNYVEDAISKGASCVVVNSGSYDVETIIVEDTRKYLSDYLVKHYNKYLEEMCIIGFTGTNGKTTSSMFLYQALNKLGLPCAAIGTIGYFTKEGKEKYLYNTLPDLCDTYELLIDAYERGHKYVVLEASSQGLHQGRVNGVVFNYAVFSNLTQDHLDYHMNMEEYALSKKILFENLNGSAILNSDDLNYKKFMLDDNKNITFGCDGDYIISEITDYSFRLNGDLFEVSFLGDYNIYNLAPDIIILYTLGFKYEDISDMISELYLPEGRLTVIKYGTNNIYLDYSHTPDGYEKVISAVRNVTCGKLIIVHGCRGDRDVLKRPIMQEIVCRLGDYVIVTKHHVYKEDPQKIIDDIIKGCEYNNFEIVFDRKDAICRGIDMLKDGDCLLVLGQGHETFMYDGKNGKIDFDEFLIASEYVGKV